MRAKLSLAVLAIPAALSACLPGQVSDAVLPPSDLKPPLVLEAGPEGPRSFLLRFDEEVNPVEGSFGLEPGPRAAAASAEGSSLRLDLGADCEPGAEYALSGEVEDGAGNATRFVFRFAGWNGRPARLALSEAQTARNSSATRPRRDFVELLVLVPGNLGGLELSWAGSAKLCSYRFPGVEVRAGDRVVLHLAPEGLPAELDEKGADLSASGGTDATAAGRDLWCAAGPLPDANGALALRSRPGGPVEDALFYAESSRSGPLGADKLCALVASLGEAWPVAGAAPAWEDAFRWKPSAARSICRREGEAAPGPESWYPSDPGAQTPGSPNAPPGLRKR